MFAPENFYHVFRSNYVRGHQDVMMTPFSNGDKEIFRFFSYIENTSDSMAWHLQSSDQRAQKTVIWMYDQEPLFSSAMNIYRATMMRRSESSITAQIIERAPFQAVLGMSSGGTTSFPIWCHSEDSSQEIDQLAKELFVPCYYWYHAFVTREWFRQYQFIYKLWPRNKSAAQHRFLLYARDTEGTRSYRRTMIENLYSMRSQIKYHWDQSGVSSPQFSAWVDVEDSESSGIHLVAETLFDTNKVYLTEKIFKPMVMSQPFILWGPPGSLAYLKRYGFQTFSNIWSEDYDMEQDHDKRMVMLCDLVNYLYNLPKEHLHDLYERCLPIIQHNRSWFFDSGFMDLCWQELDQNFSHARSQVEYLAKDHPGGQLIHLMSRYPDLLKVYGKVVKQCLASMDHTQQRKIFSQYPRFSVL